MKIIQALTGQNMRALTAAFVSIGILLASALLFLLLQRPAIYNAMASPFMNNYFHEQGQIVSGPVPFRRFNPSELLHWDAKIYQQIRDHGYDKESAGGDFIFAFFPLFPAVWNITKMSPLLMLFFNYSLLAISVFLILKDFCIKDIGSRTGLFAISLCTPMMVVFMIPYSEGLFMATATVALLGLKKGNYLIYFIAAFLMSMTRPAVIMITLALAGTEFYYYIRHRDPGLSVRSFSLKVLPLLAGTILVSLIQLSYGSGNPVMFLKAQQYWDSRLQFPVRLTDWAHEQFGSNLTLLLFIIPVSVTFLVVSAFRNRKDRRTNYEAEPQEYLFVLSLCYMILTTLSVLFMRGGSLNGISRYVLCSPFWIVALMGMRHKLLHIHVRLKIIFFSLFLTASATALSLVPYSSGWDFSDLGYVLLCTQLACFVFNGLTGKRWYVVLHVALSAIWTAYLFNMFISDAWIFT